MTDLETFMREGAALVDARLEDWLPSEDQAGQLAAAMRHIALSGGKRLRPNLVLLGCADVGGQQSDALGAAVAVELLHAYSLLHDDLPCMDDGKLRRGKPCAHLVYGEDVAVLAGDALLTLAFEVLAAHTPAHRPVGAMVVVLARASGWAGMVGGQIADLAAEGHDPDLARVTEIHEGKTAALLAASLELGALAGGGSQADAARLGRTGRDLGLAFQIVDDLLDEVGTTAALGKQVGADGDRRKMTWPAVVGVERARLDARCYVVDALATLACGRSRPGAASDLLAALGDRILQRDH